MQSREIAAHSFLHTRGLLSRGLQQRRNPLCDDVTHRQVIVGYDIKSALGLRNILGRPGHLNPPDFGMRRRQHFGEPVKRKSKHTLLSGQTRVAGKWLKGIIKEHFIGNKGDASLPAHRHDT